MEDVVSYMREKKISNSNVFLVYSVLTHENKATVSQSNQEEIIYGFIQGKYDDNTKPIRRKST
jgi:hypothetical protein